MVGILSFLGLRCWMARSGLCAKCRKGQAAEGDSWCKLCTAVESLTSLARENWATVAYRKLAEDLLTDIVRNCRSLLVLDRRTRSLVDSYTNRKKPEKTTVHPWQKEKQGLQTAAKAGAKPPLERGSRQTEAKEEASERGAEEEDETEERREEAAASAPSSGSGRRRPPEPEGPPPDRPRSRSRHRGRRGGSKHQQTFRALQNPDLQFHRKDRRSRQETGRR